MKSIITIVLTTITLFTFAQKPGDQDKAQNYYFYKKDGVTEVSTKDSAEYIEVVTEPDTGEKLYGVQQFYKNGKIRFIGKSIDVHPINLVGQSISFYPNGSKKQITIYQYNKPKGEMYSYYPNGKQYIVLDFLSIPQKNKKSFEVYKRDTLIKFEYDSAGNAIVENGKGHFKSYDDDFKTIAQEGDVENYKPTGVWKGQDIARKIIYTENYQGGKLIQGNSTDSVGNHYTYLQRVKSPEFKIGFPGFYKSLINNIRYPAYSRENNHQGKAIIRVFINNIGYPTRYEVVQSVDQYIDAEATRVVKLQQEFYPAEFYGRKEPSYLDVSVLFALQYR